MGFETDSRDHTRNGFHAIRLNLKSHKYNRSFVFWHGTFDPKGTNTMNNLHIRNTYLVFMSILVFWGFFDMYLDWKEFINDPLHYIIDIGYMLFAVFSGSYMWFSFRNSQKELIKANVEIEERRMELKEWARKHEDIIAYFREEVKDQLNKWKLTGAEIEVAVMLLRGFSLKQISAILGKSERTVRNQSIEIYRKTGMTGRHELAAFFLEQLLGFEEQE